MQDLHEQLDGKEGEITSLTEQLEAVEESMQHQLSVFGEEHAEEMLKYKAHYEQLLSEAEIAGLHVVAGVLAFPVINVIIAKVCAACFSVL